jgi:AAA domain
MTFEFKKGSRQGVSLFIAIAGPSGSGKTLSALKVARGLAGGHPGMDPHELEKIDATIAAIDTEAGRILHYAPGKGELPGPNTFAIAHGDLHGPFSGEAYLEAINRAEQAGFKVIVIDSFSHIWEGEGGAKAYHKELVQNAVEKARKRHKQFNRQYPFNADKAADAAKVTAWDEAKAGYKRVLARIGQLRAHVIVCLRAEEKLQIIIEKDEETGREKTKYVQTKDLPEAQRWVPLIEHRFHYEPIMSLVLSPTAPGVPHPIKLQEQHKVAVREGTPLSERAGLLLARWAAGESIEEGRVAEPKAQPRQIIEPAPAEAMRAPPKTFLQIMEEIAEEEGVKGLREARAAAEAKGHTRRLEVIDTNWLELQTRAEAADERRAGASAEKSLPGI